MYVASPFIANVSTKTQKIKISRTGIPYFGRTPDQRRRVSCGETSLNFDRLRSSPSSCRDGTATASGSCWLAPHCSRRLLLTPQVNGLGIRPGTESTNSTFGGFLPQQNFITSAVRVATIPRPWLLSEPGSRLYYVLLAVLRRPSKHAVTCCISAKAFISGGVVDSTASGMRSISPPSVPFVFRCCVCVAEAKYCGSSLPSLFLDLKHHALLPAWVRCAGALNLPFQTAALGEARHGEHDVDFQRVPRPG